MDINQVDLSQHSLLLYLDQKYLSLKLHSKKEITMPNSGSYFINRHVINDVWYKFISFAVSTYSSIIQSDQQQMHSAPTLLYLYVSIDSGYIFILKASVVDQETRKNFSASVIIP